MKSSQRLRDVQVSRTLDEHVRKRHQQRHLDELENDNYAVSSDMLEGVDLSRRATDLLLDGRAGQKAKKKVRKRELRRLFTGKRSFVTLVEESRIDMLPATTPTYLTAAVKPSALAPRRFCSVCGFHSHYNCIKCGMKYCSVTCKVTHEDTRCMKFTV